MRILITRPREDAAPFAAALRTRGHTPILEAIIEIVPATAAGAPIALDGVQAVIFTSANGVRAFAKLSDRRDLPVFAVGDSSARAAREAGFAKVESAAGDVDDLARLVAARLQPADGALFHGAARSLAGDLKGTLEGAGFTLRREVLYETRTATDLSPTTRTALSHGEIDAATFFSPRTGQSFVDLVQKADLAGACASVDAVCLSAAVAEKLDVLPWRSIRIAAQPNQDALLECIDGMAARDEAGAVEGTMPADEKPDHSPAANTGGSKPEPAKEVIVKFGGIRPMASKLGVAVSTVQGWRERDSIPSARHHQILAAAKAHSIDIDAETLAASDRAPEGDSSAQPEEPAAMAENVKENAAEAPEPAKSRLPTRPSEPAKLSDTAEPSAPVARGGGWTGPFLIAAVVFVAGAGGAVLTREAWMPYLAATPGESPEAARIEALEDLLAEMSSKLNAAPGAAQITELEDKFAALAAASSAAPDEGALAAARAEIETLRGDLTAMSTRLDSLGEIAQAGADTEQLGAALGKIEARNAELSAQMATDIDALRAEISTLATQRTAAPSASEPAMALAILRIRDALRGAEPFADALGTVETLTAGVEGEAGNALRAAIAPLRPYAAQGAPSLESLQAAFPAVARAAIAQAHGGEGQDLWVKTVRSLSALVSIRPHGPVEGDSTEAIVARTEALLEAGDLASAVRELNSLNAPAMDAVAEWRQRAEARLAAQSALDRLGGLLAGQG